MVVAVRQLYLTYTQQRVSACIDEVHSWMQSNRLQLNINKSELLRCATARRQHQLPRCPFRTGADINTSFRQRLFEISVFIRALISACRRMSSGLSQVALQSCVSYAAFVDLFRRSGADPKGGGFVRFGRTSTTAAVPILGRRANDVDKSLN